MAAPKTKIDQMSPDAGSMNPGAVRTRILDAALDLFESKGFNATAVPEIAKCAGVATGSIYRHFESKDALVNALYREWKQVYYNMVLMAPKPNASPRETFSDYWRAMAHFARTYPKASRFLDLHRHSGYLDQESQKYQRDYLAAAARFIEDGVRAGAVKPIQPQLLLALMWGAMRGLIQFSGDGDLTLNDETIHAAEICVWNAIRA